MRTNWRQTTLKTSAISAYCISHIEFPLLVTNKHLHVEQILDLCLLYLTCICNVTFNTHFFLIFSSILIWEFKSFCFIYPLHRRITAACNCHCSYSFPSLHRRFTRTSYRCRCSKYSAAICMELKTLNLSNCVCSVPLSSRNSMSRRTPRPPR